MSFDVILIKPSITEKSFKLAQSGQFTFFVKKSASKHAIAHAIEELFKVNVIKVRTVKKAGKVKRSGKSKIAKKYSDQKKAIVTLKPGQMIEYFKLPEEKRKAQRTQKKSVSSVLQKSQSSTPGVLKKQSKPSLLGKLKKITKRTQDK
ncbi:MAG: 50S ribosomal protein L23 [Candidatus Beckwithbacteria bacterium]|nr:50S ribosomal protein L23 [Patescibacteria group bacterium]